MAAPPTFVTLDADVLLQLIRKVENLEAFVQANCNDGYIDHDTTSQYLGVAANTLRAWVEEGIITRFTIGGKVMYKRSVIDAEVYHYRNSKSKLKPPPPWAKMKSLMEVASAA